MHFTRAACDGLGGVDLMEDRAHGKHLVDELCDKLFPGALQFVNCAVACFPIDGCDIFCVPPAVFAEVFHEVRFCCGFAKVRCVFCGDACIVNLEHNLAGRDEGDRCLRLTWSVQGIGGVGGEVRTLSVSTHVSSHHFFLSSWWLQTCSW